MPVIFPYYPNSPSAQRLRVATTPLMNRVTSRTLNTLPSSITIVNYGNALDPSSNTELSVRRVDWVNHPNAVRNVSSKLRFFSRNERQDLAVPWTDSLEDARWWIDNGTTVVARTILNGHSGNGIILLDRDNISQYDLSNVRLFTKYIPKRYEFRVHMFNNNIIDLQKKSAIRSSEVAPDWRIRTHRTGFIYSRENLSTIHPNVINIVSNAASEVFRPFNLDFGAVDVIYNERENRAYVLEINSAPGIEGATVDSYAQALSNYFSQIR